MSSSRYNDAMHVQTGQVRRLLQLTGELSELGHDAQARRARLVEGLAGLLGADVVTFARVDDLLKPDFQASVGWDEEYRRAVMGYIAEHGPAPTRSRTR
jgi:hypothetical protein